MKKGKSLNKGSAGQNRKAGITFVEKYLQKHQPQQTQSGLIYRVIELGNGDSPTPDSTVAVNQRILTVDGSVIADTYRSGLADEFSLKEAIPGLREALLLMNIGSRWEVVVIPELAWGKKGAGNTIGPNATLVFDVRLLRII